MAIPEFRAKSTEPERQNNSTILQILKKNNTIKSEKFQFKLKWKKLKFLVICSVNRI